MEGYSQKMKGAWESFANTYIHIMEKQTFAFYIMLSNMMKLQSAKNILEVAGGSGYAIKYAKSIISSDCHYTMSDFSEEMLNVAHSRLTTMCGTEKPLPNSFLEGSEYPEINVSLLQADNMNLEKFSDNHFDRYISVLSMMLVEDPMKQIKEAFRVTKPGGIAGFTVIGRKENTTLLSNFPKILMEMGVELPNERTIFHLSDREKLISMLKEAGFINIKAWYSINPMNHDKETIFQFYETQPMARKLRGLLSKEQSEELDKRILAKIDKMNEENAVFQFENLMIVAEKQ